MRCIDTARIYHTFTWNIREGDIKMYISKIENYFFVFNHSNYVL